MPERAVIVLELENPTDMQRALDILAVVRLPEFRGYLAVQDSADRVLAVFGDAKPGADAERIDLEDRR
jgi:hypothetical protein